MLAYNLNLDRSDLAKYLTKGTCRLAPSKLTDGSTQIFVSKKDGKRLERAKKSGRGVQLKDLDDHVYNQNAKVWQTEHLSAPPKAKQQKRQPVAVGHKVSEHPHPTARRNGETRKKAVMNLSHPEIELRGAKGRTTKTR